MSDYLDAAAAIAERLVSEAVRDDGKCTWFGASMENIGGKWRPSRRTFGGDPYAGTSGVALFLAQFHRFQPSDEVKQTALAALRHALDRADNDATLDRGALYTGAFGVGFAAAEAGAELGDEAIAARGLALVRDAMQRHDETAFDVVSGSAGRIGALVRLHHRFGERWLVDDAVRDARALLATAHRQPYGWSWGFGGTQYVAHDLTGYSHGTAGVALAMLELNAVAPDPAFVQAADEAMRYERAWFSPQQQNWPDFRRMPGQTAADPFAYGYAWCHGAPGIGMSRLRAYRLTGRADVLAEARTALASSRSSGLATETEYSFGICHGAAGNAELFLQAYEVLGDEAALADADRIARKGMEQHLGGGTPWPCGLEDAGEAPGLMLGLAGIGYFYLRMHGRADVPSLLTIGNIP